MIPARRPLALFSGLALLALVLAGCPHAQTTAPDAGPPSTDPMSAVADRTQVVQALLESPWIQGAVERKEDDKSALVVVVPPDLEGQTLRAFGQAARVLTPKQAQAQRPESFLELHGLKVDGNRASLAFEDEAEELSGEAQLERTAQGWRVAQVTGTEE